MIYEQYKLLEEYYLEVEKHLFKSKLTFAEWLSTLDEEALDALNGSKCKATDKFLSKKNYITLAIISELVSAITVDAPANDTNNNILVKHTIHKDYEVITYSLKASQSYSSHEAIATKYIQVNSVNLKGSIVKCIVGGLLESTKNTRVYLYINKKENK